MSSNEKKLVLITDDEAEIREILAIHVESLGFEVVEAENGQEAMEIVEKENIDIILSDIMMPKMTGMMFLRALHDKGYGAIPFIFITAYPSKEATIEALRLGAFDFLEKPFVGEDIKRLVTEAMRVAKQKKAPSSRSESSPEELQIEDKITELKSLRYDSEEKSESKEENRLLEMFIDEAMPQLVFCESSIKKLHDEENRTWELGYLFRVFKSLHEAAVALKIDEISKPAQVLEGCFTYFRTRPEYLNEGSIELLEKATNYFRSMISSIGSPDESYQGFAEIEEELKSIDKS